MRLLSLFEKKLALFIILLVTGMSFLAGYVQNNYQINADNARDNANRHETNSIKIEDRLRTISTLDGEQSLQANSRFLEAAFIALKYSTIKASFTITLEEETNYALDFMFALMDANSMIRTTFAGVVHSDFTNNANKQTYDIATESKEGFDYKIERDSWELYTPMYTVSKTQFFTELGLGDISEDVADIDWLPNDYLFYKLDWDNVYSLYRVPLWDEVDLKQYYSQLAEEYESKSFQLAIGVSITTISTILASSMASRLDDRKIDYGLVSIRSNLGENSEDIKHEPSDFFALLGLILALVIAFVGLLSPLLLQLI